MINLRYHIVSLTAVFLALIIGILMGTTVISKATVDGLRSNLHRAEVRSEAVHDRNGALSTELSERKDTATSVDKALSDQVLAHTVDGVLEDVPVLVIASSAVDEDTLGGVVTALSAAGADLDGTLVIDDRLSPENLDTDRLAELLEVDPDAALLSILTTRLAAVLAEAAHSPARPDRGQSSSSTATSDPARDDTGGTTSAPPESSTSTTLPAPEEPDLISALRSAGFLDFRPLDGHPDDGDVLTSEHLRDGVGYRYVVLSGADPDVPDRDMLIPLITKVARDGDVPVVAASAPDDTAGADEPAFIGPLRDLDAVAGKISTVDNLGSFAGAVALVFALEEAADGHFGHYGIAEGASAVIPPITP